jgi:hypothetical protein
VAAVVVFEGLVAFDDDVLEPAGKKRSRAPAAAATNSSGRTGRRFLFIEASSQGRKLTNMGLSPCTQLALTMLAAAILQARSILPECKPKGVGRDPLGICANLNQDNAVFDSFIGCNSTECALQGHGRLFG